MKDSDWRDMSDFCRGFLATAGDLGGPPTVQERMLPLALVREGRRIAFDDDDFLQTRHGDVVIYARSEQHS